MKLINLNVFSWNEIEDICNGSMSEECQKERIKNYTIKNKEIRIRRKMGGDKGVHSIFVYPSGYSLRSRESQPFFWNFKFLYYN